MKEVVARLEDLCLGLARLAERARIEADHWEGTGAYVHCIVISACFDTARAQCKGMKRPLSAIRGDQLHPELVSALAAYWRAVKAIVSACRFNRGIDIPELPDLKRKKEEALPQAVVDLLQRNTNELRKALRAHRNSFRITEAL